MEFSIGIDDVVENVKCTIHRSTGTGTDTGNGNGRCILDLATSEAIRLIAQNEGGTENFDIFHMNLTATLIGG